MLKTIVRAVVSITERPKLYNIASSLLQELRKFAIFIVRKFTEVAHTNPKVFMELLFWKNQRDAYVIEHGYDDNNENK